MKPGTNYSPIDWTVIRCLVFDVDGTLYRQTPVRIRMARDLAQDAVKSGQLRTVRILKAYRRIRERLGDDGVQNFEPQLLAATSAACGSSVQIVSETVAEWIEERPLPYLRSAAVSGSKRLFERARELGHTVAVLSDYPARNKLKALGLEADYVVSASDAEIGSLKPDPRGLCAIIERANVRPEQTIMIGDRIERDGLVARRIGAAALIRSRKPLDGWNTFENFSEPVFAALLDAA
jgi:HAD superfamily hydrolase (TIGR01549 family)